MLSHNVNRIFILKTTLSLWFSDFSDFFSTGTFLSYYITYERAIMNSLSILFISLFLSQNLQLFLAYVAGAKRGGRGGGRKAPPLPFSLLFPYPLPLSTPAKLFPKIGTHFSPQRSRLYTRWPYFEERLKKQGNKSNLALSAFLLVASCKGV